MLITLTVIFLLLSICSLKCLGDLIGMDTLNGFQGLVNSDLEVPSTMTLLNIFLSFGS